MIKRNSRKIHVESVDLDDDQKSDFFQYDMESLVGSTNKNGYLANAKKNTGSNNKYTVSGDVLSFLSPSTYSLLQRAQLMKDSYDDKNTYFKELSSSVTDHFLTSLETLKEILNECHNKQLIPNKNLFQLHLLDFITNGLAKFVVFTLMNDWTASGLQKQSIYGYFTACQSILKKFPEMLRQRDKMTGKCLLHHITQKVNFLYAGDLVSTILHLYPDALNIQDKYGNLPLHYLVANPYITYVVAAEIVKMYTEGCKIRNKSGFIPLHIALKQKPIKPDIIELLLSIYPLSSTILDPYGNLPMHIACNNKSVDKNTLKLLFDLYPDALRTASSDGYMPIHILVSRQQPSLENIKFLVLKNPKSLELLTKNGKTALHLASENQKISLDIINYLIQNNPQACRVIDENGYLPLHLAMDHAQPNNDVIDLLIKLHPDGVKTVTHDGLLPLHLAIGVHNDPSIQIITQLMTFYPESATYAAIEYRPVNESADPFTWTGEWKQHTWTPLSRAIDRKLTKIIEKMIKIMKEECIDYPTIPSDLLASSNSSVASHMSGPVMPPGRPLITRDPSKCQSLSLELDIQQRRSQYHLKHPPTLDTTTSTMDENDIHIHGGGGGGGGLGGSINQDKNHPLYGVNSGRLSPLSSMNYKRRMTYYENLRKNTHENTSRARGFTVGNDTSDSSDDEDDDDDEHDNENNDIRHTNGIIMKDSEPIIHVRHSVSSPSKARSPMKSPSAPSDPAPYFKPKIIQREGSLSSLHSAIESNQVPRQLRIKTTNSQENLLQGMTSSDRSLDNGDNNNFNNNNDNSNRNKVKSPSIPHPYSPTNSIATGVSSYAIGQDHEISAPSKLQGSNLAARNSPLYSSKSRSIDVYEDRPPSRSITGTSNTLKIQTSSPIDPYINSGYDIDSNQSYAIPRSPANSTTGDEKKDKQSINHESMLQPSRSVHGSVSTTHSKGMSSLGSDEDDNVSFYNTSNQGINVSTTTNTNNNNDNNANTHTNTHNNVILPTLIQPPPQHIDQSMTEIEINKMTSYSLESHSNDSRRLRLQQQSIYQNKLSSHNSPLNVTHITTGNTTNTTTNSTTANTVNTVISPKYSTPSLVESKNDKNVENDKNESYSISITTDKVGQRSDHDEKSNSYHSTVSQDNVSTTTTTAHHNPYRADNDNKNDLGNTPPLVRMETNDSFNTSMYINQSNTKAPLEIQTQQYDNPPPSSDKTPTGSPLKGRARRQQRADRNSSDPNVQRIQGQSTYSEPNEVDSRGTYKYGHLDKSQTTHYKQSSHVAQFNLDDDGDEEYQSKLDIFKQNISNNPIKTNNRTPNRRGSVNDLPAQASKLLASFLPHHTSHPKSNDVVQDSDSWNFMKTSFTPSGGGDGGIRGAVSSDFGVLSSGNRNKNNNAIIGQQRIVSKDDSHIHHKSGSVSGQARTQNREDVMRLERLSSINIIDDEESIDMSQMNKSSGGGGGGSRGPSVSFAVSAGANIAQKAISTSTSTTPHSNRPKRMSRRMSSAADSDSIDKLDKEASKRVHDGNHEWVNSNSNSAISSDIYDYGSISGDVADDASQISLLKKKKPPRKSIKM